MYLWAVYNPADEQLANLVSGCSDYLFDDCDRVSIDEQFAWCDRCKAFRAAERLMSPDMKNRQLEQAFWLRFRDERTAFLRDALRRQQEEIAREREVWFRYLARERTSPPRCLTCGSCELRLLPEERSVQGWMQHPCDSTMIRIQWAGHAGHTVTK